MHPLSRITAAVLLTMTLGASALAASAWPSTSTLEIGGSVRAVDSNIEPSGLTWHSGRNQLFMVGDEGEIVAMDKDGNNVTKWSTSGDLEDITVQSTSSNSVFLADEDGKIVKYDLARSRTVKSWDVTAWMPEVNGAGMEALTYANGYFYAGYQANGKIYVLDLSRSTARKVREISGPSGYTDLSGLHYRDGYLYALYSNTLFIMTTDGTVKASYSVPGTDQEGIALGADSNGDGDADMYIAEDSSQNLYQFDGFPLYR